MYDSNNKMVDFLSGDPGDFNVRVEISRVSSRTPSQSLSCQGKRSAARIYSSTKNRRPILTCPLPSILRAQHKSCRNPGMLDPTNSDRKLSANMASVWNCKFQHSGVSAGLHNIYPLSNICNRLFIYKV